jgi:uncharacterized membrane protein
MADKEKFEKWLSENSFSILTVILGISVVSVMLVIGFYALHFHSLSIEAKPEPWGQFGDFFGGTLNPIFGFLSVIALLAALVIQGRELKVSSEELRNSALALNAQNRAIAHQSFEQTFFSWLENYRDMLGSIEYITPKFEGGGEFQGRRALRNWWMGFLSESRVAHKVAKLEKQMKGDMASYAEEHILQAVAQDAPALITDAALDAWESLYRSNEYHLDSLFRNLFKLVQWIDSQDESRMNSAEKWLYISIVRGQLSWVELVYLFYNGLTVRGYKFKRLIEKYALLDNLNFDSDFVISHIKEYPPKGNCYLSTAYESRVARKELGLPESTEETLAMAVG